MIAYRCSQLNIARSTSPHDAGTLILAQASHALVLSRQQACVHRHSMDTRVNESKLREYVHYAKGSADIQALVGDIKTEWAHNGPEL